MDATSPSRRPDRPQEASAGGELDGDLLETLVAQRTVRLGCMVSAGAAVGFGALYAWRGPTEFVVPNLVASGVLLLGALAPIRANTGIYLAISVALTLLGYQLVLLGGIDNGIATWFLVPFLAAAILGERRLAVASVVLTVAELVSVVVAARFGWLVPRAVMPDPDVVMAGSLVAVMGLCGLFGYLAHRARRQLLAALEARNATLERALVEMERARAAAIDASRAKEQFFANLTHEIRTPLTGIAGTAELIQRTHLTMEQEPLARALVVSTRNLTELVNAMLDHARVRAGHVTVVPSTVDVRAFAQDLMQLYAARASDRGLELRVVADAAPPFIEIDAVKLRQIAANLLSNAIKFTQAGRVEVEIRGGASLVLTVKDTGPGIDPAQHERIFEPFEQGESTIARTHGGSGLGLTIARELARLMLGDLRVESVVGSGSTFTLTLPLTLARGPNPSAEPMEVASLVGLNVLLVEDNEVNRMVARMMLESLGAQVTEATDGNAAVRAARSKSYAMILMDLQMPHLDGISAARQIRAHEHEAGQPLVPIVAMTGNASDDYAGMCADAGMTGFVIKPVSIEQLRVTLASVL